MEYLDDMFSQFAEAFLGNMEGEGDIPYRNRLTILKLDYTTESLKEVESYLTLIHKNVLNISDIEYQNAVVWGGDYVGEVIRRNAIIDYHWIHYDDYMKNKNPDLKKMIPLTLPTHAFLFGDKTNYITMPMNKIARRLDEGSSNNIHFYAVADISRKG